MFPVAVSDVWRMLTTMFLAEQILPCTVDDKDLIIPSFPNVKYLELRATVQFHENLLLLMGYAEACPLLHDLKLELNWICRCAKVASDFESGSEYESDTESENESDLESELGSELENYLDWKNMSNSWSDECSLDYVKHWLETQEGTNATLPNLRKLEWSRAFSFHDDQEFSLALYCIKNAAILQKFICDPRGDTDEIVEGCRQHARKLAEVVPSHIEYVIL